MDFSESKASAARKIALAFDVPPLILGLPWKRNPTILSRDAYGAAVIVVHNKHSKNGFSIITAFPIFD